MNWTHQQKLAVWAKGRIAAQNDANKWRQDACGAWIGWDFFGDRESQYGWEIDHINPNGGDGLANLQPLQWGNNAAKGDGPLVCAVPPQGQNNVAVR